MVLKLYGAPFSTCTRRAAIALKETDTPFEIVPVTSFEVLGSEEYKQKQPFGQMPYIDDDGFILYESRSIARYVAQKAGSKLVPAASDIKALAKYDQAQNIEAFDFEPVALGIAMERVFKVMRGMQTDEARVEEHKATLEKKLAGYERILSKTKYLTGDEISLVDLFHLPHGTLVAQQPDINLLEDGTKFPNVARWWKDLTARPSWQAVKDTVEP